MLNSTAPIASPETRRFVRFVAVGLLNAAFGYTLFAAGILVGLGPEIALLIATVLGVCFNFLTTGRLVFADRDQSRIVRFVLAYVASYLINVAMLRGLVGAGVPPLLAQVLALPAVVVLTFLMLRTFVFRESRR